MNSGSRQNERMEDAQLVQDFRGGNHRAFNKLVVRWQDRIHHFAYRFFASSDDAAEITQKTFIKAYHKLHTLEDVNKFGSWLYTIANNLCLDELKRVGRKRATSYEALKVAPQTETATPADGTILRNEGLVLLHKALLQLPVDQRVVVIMKEYEGLTFREIAEILDEPENTIKSRLYYGLSALKKTFDSWNINKEVFDYE
ncbi:MAG TPA: RNA polymerase sigma factor [Gracilimonas sp.]|uniref:RNA polymerase sigma factor n=1 Tax=Gracilimonas sp. TaxID=1974203 RepID=UPI002D943AD6|nr:RNA polymerase sigma factor [Gracilimonas sp.]